MRWAELLAGIISLVVSAAGGGALSIWYTRRKDRREANQDKREEQAAQRDSTTAAMEVSDRVIELLEKANKLAVDNARLEYESKLAATKETMQREHDAKMDALRETLTADLTQQVKREVRAMMAAHGCRKAEKGCPHREPLLPEDVQI